MNVPGGLLAGGAPPLGAFAGRAAGADLRAGTAAGAGLGAAAVEVRGGRADGTAVLFPF